MMVDWVHVAHSSESLPGLPCVGAPGRLPSPPSPPLPPFLDSSAPPNTSTVASQINSAMLLPPPLPPPPALPPFEPQPFWPLVAPVHPPTILGSPPAEPLNPVFPDSPSLPFAGT